MKCKCKCTAQRSFVRFVRSFVRCCGQRRNKSQRSCSIINVMTLRCVAPSSLLSSLLSSRLSPPSLLLLSSSPSSLSLLLLLVVVVVNALSCHCITASLYQCFNVCMPYHCITVSLCDTASMDRRTNHGSRSAPGPMNSWTDRWNDGDTVHVPR